MTQKKKYYFCFALAISICMTVLIQVFQLYSLPILGILELFMLVNVCMIAVNIFNRKCLNHVGTLIITGSLFLFLLARNTFLFLFSFSIYCIKRLIPGRKKRKRVPLRADSIMEYF